MLKVEIPLREMEKWPHTPDPVLLRDTLKMHLNLNLEEAEEKTTETGKKPSRKSLAQRRQAAAENSREIDLILYEPAWQARAIEAYNNRIKEISDNFTNRIEIMASVAAVADNEETMGLAILTHHRPEEYTETDPNDRDEPGPQASIAFARLLRKDNWTGICQVLPLVHGLTAVIVESRKSPGRISHTICIPTQMITTPDARTPESESLNLPAGRELEEILRWHGVKGTLQNAIKDQG